MHMTPAELVGMLEAEAREEIAKIAERRIVTVGGALGIDPSMFFRHDRATPAVILVIDSISEHIGMTERLTRDVLDKVEIAPSRAEDDYNRSYERFTRTQPRYRTKKGKSR